MFLTIQGVLSSQMCLIYKNRGNPSLLSVEEGWVKKWLGYEGGVLSIGVEWLRVLSDQECWAFKGVECPSILGDQMGESFGVQEDGVSKWFSSWMAKRV